MLKVRLQRIGRKKNPFYRVVVIEHTKPLSGKYVEKIGYYNPLTKPKNFKIDEEKLIHWLSCGAKVSETVAKLIFKFSPHKKLIKDFGINEIVKELRKRPKKEKKVKKQVSQEKILKKESPKEESPLQKEEVIEEEKPKTEPETPEVKEEKETTEEKKEEENSGLQKEET